MKQAREPSRANDDILTVAKYVQIKLKDNPLPTYF
jgi:hypothetical protein